MNLDLRRLWEDHRWFMSHSRDYVRAPYGRRAINGYTIRTLLLFPRAWLRFMILSAKSPRKE